MPPLRFVRHPTGAVVLRSTLLDALDVPHGFSTRLGGVSAAPFDTLNCAGDVSAGGDDEPSRREENRRRLLAAAGLEERGIAGLRLVHGADVVDAVADEDTRLADPPDASSRSRSPEADAIISTDARLALLVTVADCVPILLASPSAGRVAAVHCGWRGALAHPSPAADRGDPVGEDVGAEVGVIAATIHRLSAARRNDFVAAIGPCIGVEAFEVGEEVATEFIRAGLGDFVIRRPEWPRPHVDLFGVVHAQLVSAGVPPRSIDGVPTCTVTDAEHFFSHRRDAGRTGRMAAVIGCRRDWCEL